MLFLYQVVFTVGGSNLHSSAQTTLAQVLEFAARTLALTQLVVLLPEVTRLLSSLPLPPPSAFSATSGKLVGGGSKGSSRAAGEPGSQMKDAALGLEVGALAGKHQQHSVDVVDGALPSKMDAHDSTRITRSAEDEDRISRASERSDTADAEERAIEDMADGSADCDVDGSAGPKRFPDPLLVSFQLALPALDAFSADASAGLFLESFTRLLQLLHAVLSLVAVLPPNTTPFSRYCTCNTVIDSFLLSYLNL